MAEAVLGVIASGAGLASLTIQLLENAQKIHALRNAMQDAPKEIAELLEELDILTSILMHFITTCQTSSSVTCTGVPSPLQRALTHCQTILRSLHGIALETQTYMSKSKTDRWISWSRLKVTMRREKLVDWQNKLERAKSMLMLAVALRPMYIIQSSISKPCGNDEDDRPGTEALDPEQRPSVLAQSHDIAYNVCDTRITTKRSTSYRSTMTYNVGFAIVTFGEELRAYPRTKNANEVLLATSSMSINFAPWLSNMALTLTSMTSCRGTKRVLETSRLVSPDALIFILCAIGDGNAVRRLISEGKASAFDVTFEGVTPLMVGQSSAHSVERGYSTPMTLLISSHRWLLVTSIQTFVLSCLTSKCVRSCIDWHIIRWFYGLTLTIS